MPRRRSLLRTTAAGAVVAVAGCTDDIDELAGDLGSLTDQSSAPLDENIDEETVERAGEVGQRLRESVVFLESSLGPRTRSNATAFCYGGSEYLVTNAHNVTESEEFTAWTYGGDRYDAELVEYVSSRRPDIALLRVDGLDLDPLPRGTSESLERGQPLVQVGHPSIMGNWIITVGPFEEDTAFGSSGLRTRVPGIQGNSGSPLATLDGDVVGVTYGATSPERRGPDDPPQRPPTDEAHTELVGRMVSLHETVEDVTEWFENWT